MVSVMKSPNMISTTGRRPVIAAPTASPVKPASEIGVSTTRSVPNSSTSPDSTLNGVPASATSSPRMQTRESRRISSASASRIASAKVISRAPASGIDVLTYLIEFRIGSRDGNFDGFLHLRFDLRMDLREGRGVCVILIHQPIAQILDGIALGDPFLLFFFRSVIFAVDIAHMMTAIPVGIAKNKSGSLPAA